MKEIGILALCLIVIFLVGCQSETPKAEVDLLIEALPEVSDLTIYHQHQITMIREKIDELDDKERALVDRKSVV